MGMKLGSYPGLGTDGLWCKGLALSLRVNRPDGRPIFPSPIARPSPLPIARHCPSPIARPCPLLSIERQMPIAHRPSMPLLSIARHCPSPRSWTIGANAPPAHRPPLPLAPVLDNRRPCASCPSPAPAHLPSLVHAPPVNRPPDAHRPSPAAIHNPSPRSWTRARRGVVNSGGRGAMGSGGRSAGGAWTGDGRGAVAFD